METWLVLVTLPSLWQVLLFTTTVEMKNSHFSFSTSQALYMNPALRLSSLHLSSIFPFFFFFICVCRLGEDKPPSLSAPSEENPNTNSEKLFIVHRQLPPGVLGVPECLAKNAVGDSLSEITSFLRYWEKSSQWDMWMLHIICFEATQTLSIWTYFPFCLCRGPFAGEILGLPWRRTLTDEDHD